MIFDRESSIPADRLVFVDVAALRLLRRADFLVRTREDANGTADLISQLLPDLPMARLGLCELLLNAIEHGNLELGGRRKAALIREGRFEHEVAARLAAPPYRDRVARVEVRRSITATEIAIEDAGAGFAWRDVGRDDIAASAEPNGRGIALARASGFATIEYRDPGNLVVITARSPA
jgi:anti-sigma regulatory factor (Ser/Thr protein kinase)